MITVAFTEAEANALTFVVTGLGTPENREALRTANNKLATALVQGGGEPEEPARYLGGPLHGREVDNYRSTYRKPDGAACTLIDGDRRTVGKRWGEGETGIYARGDRDYRWIPAP